MATETQWARIVEAVARPHTVPTSAERAQLLQETLSLGYSVLPDLVGCSVTQAVDGDMGTGYRTPVASNDLAITLDRAQYAAGDGPCVAACRDGQTHSVPVMDDEDAFGAFSAAAVEHNVHSSLSLPLAHPRPSAINLYAGDPHAFAGDRPRAAADFLARCVAGLLPNAEPVPAERAMTSATVLRRELIERACAEVAEREGCGMNRAFQRLTMLSREQQRSVFDIARSLVEAGSNGVPA